MRREHEEGDAGACSRKHHGAGDMQVLPKAIVQPGSATFASAAAL